MSQTIGDLLARACQRYGDRPAVVRDGTALTYAGLLDAGARLANALRGAGVPAVLRVHVTGQVGSGSLKARPPRRTFWQWLLRRPASYD